MSRSTSAAASATSCSKASSSRKRGPTSGSVRRALVRLVRMELDSLLMAVAVVGDFGGAAFGEGGLKGDDLGGGAGLEFGHLVGREQALLDDELCHAAG